LLDVGGFGRRDNRLCRKNFRVQGGGQSGGRAELQDISAMHWILSPANLNADGIIGDLKIMSQK
jgi:hypothetical protein